MMVREMEMSHHSGAEAESLLRPERGAVLVQGRTGWDGEGEKAPFLRHEPVKLTPAWEGSNLPNDTLNLKGIAMDLAPPKDRGNLIYLTMVLHGLGTLTAWNMFITAKDYFVLYKLVGVPEYSANFMVAIGWASQIPNFLFSWFNVFYPIGGNLKTRIVWSLCIEVVIFVITVLLAMLDSTSWPVEFFWITIGTVFVLNGCNAVFQNSVFGVAARLPPKYTGAVILGSNICGTLVVLLGWLSDTLGGSLRTAAIYYFIGGMFVLLVCFDTYFALPLNRFYRYHDTLQQRTLRANPQPATNHQLPMGQRLSEYFRQFFTIIKKCYVQLYNVFIIFFVSLAVFPAVHSDIKPLEPDFLGKNFTRVTCFLTFNVMAMLGNITAGLWQFPSRRWLAVFTTLRILFIPAFLLSNYQPENVARALPVLVTSDWAYWALSVMLGWSSGHGSSLAMMYVSGNVPPELAAKAGMVGGAMLITGILCGISFSGLGPALVAASWGL